MEQTTVRFLKSIAGAAMPEYRMGPFEFHPDDRDEDGNLRVHSIPAELAVKWIAAGICKPVGAPAAGQPPVVEAAMRPAARPRA